MRLRSWTNRVKTLQRKLYPPPKPEIWLPLGVYLDEEGHYLPGHEEIAARCERAGIIPNVFIGFNPDEDGIEQ